jgi:aspartate 1-decarboxylase
MMKSKIEGGQGEGCLNGAVARLVACGDRVILITYGDYEDDELEDYLPGWST